MARERSRLARFKAISDAFVKAVVLCVLGFAAWKIYLAYRIPVKVAILQPLTGTQAITGLAMVEAYKVAIDAVNARGGVLGRQLEPVILDTRPEEPEKAAEAATQALEEEGAAVLFGPLTSAERKAVAPVVEAHQGLLIYPRQSEGIESFPSVFYAGPLPNQLAVPAFRWALTTLGKRFFLVGTDTVFPRTVAAMLTDEAADLNAEKVGEAFFRPGTQEMDDIVDEVLELKPDFVINLIGGDSNIPWVKALRGAGIKSSQTPTLFLNVSAPELRAMGADDITGDYVAASYFDTLESAANTTFLQLMRGRPRATQGIGASQEAAYSSVLLWAAAAKRAKTVAPAEVAESFPGLRIETPGGDLMVDLNGQHVEVVARVGQIDYAGSIKPVWEAEAPIDPVPYPITRTHEEWEGFQKKLFVGWKGTWGDAQLNGLGR